MEPQIETIQMVIVKRNGEVVNFNPDKIKNALSKAIRSIDSKVDDKRIEKILSDIVEEVHQRFIDFHPNVENVQDIVEKHLMRNELYEVAKSFILYRNKRQEEREQESKEVYEKAKLGKLRVKKRDGRTVLFNLTRIKEDIQRASIGFEQEISIDTIAKEVIKNIYDGCTVDDIERALVLGATAFIEKDPLYSKVAGRLFLQKLYKEVVGEKITNLSRDTLYKRSFIYSIQKGVEEKIIDPKLLDFNLERLSNSLKLERDDLIQFMGMETLYGKYLIKTKERRLELPQVFWMRVAMGLSINEENKNDKAIEFYELLSSLRFVSSTPTLLHSGTTHPQLSSCFLNTVEDDLKHIFKVYGDNAQLSKWAGGIGTDWSNIRGTGAIIKSNKVESQGVIPFLKIANDVTVSINRGGRRRGAKVAYLETWHIDIEDFLDLRKNTGDERRRTHDMNTANWIPDLFMKRVLNNENWTLFSPEEVPELHHIYGKKFEKKYIEYEEKAKKGEIQKHKRVSALKLWRKMLSMLFETGHPWMTFKDPCNIRSPQDHVGVVHASNLCTEITLNTSDEETAVCNLGSINLEKHITNNQLNSQLLEQTINTAIRMLDNVIDINYYPTKEARNSNLKHRPIGLGIMGFQDALYKLNINFESKEAVEFADKSMELISYFAILTSSKIAKEKGKYESYDGSKWSKNVFPIDTLKLLEEERGVSIDIPKQETLDWTPVREHVKLHGIRNSNIMAIAPTATIANIAGCFPCIEPIFKNIYAKSNMHGEFTVTNHYLVEDLKKLGLWSEDMLEQIKYHDGNVEIIAGIPDSIKEKYREVFEIDPKTIINIAAVRGKWIDQSQSLNIFIKGVSGKKLDETYKYAWQMGLKTTYYLRSLGASQIEKSTLDTKYGFTQKREYNIINSDNKSNLGPKISPLNSQNQQIQLSKTDSKPKLCLIEDPDCEACQ